MAEKKLTATEAETAEVVDVEDQPVFEGSLSDAPFMAAPDGHDVTKNALDPKGK